MNKLGLCIVYKNWNYGSILQSYATLLELRKQSVPYEIIRYEPKKGLAYYWAALPRLLLPDMRYSKLRLLRKKIGMWVHRDFAGNDSVRAQAFQRFTEHNFDHFSRIITRYDELCQYAEQFDAVLVGSDQLWLPSGLDTNFFNLMFVPERVNKIAYAASFGVSAVPERQKKRTTEYLGRIQHISVREHAGQKLIRDLTGRDVPVIVDPTLVISKQEWDANIPDQRLVQGPYIFCYFLGSCPEQRDAANDLRRKTGLKIVTLHHLDEYIPSDESFGDEAPYLVGPSEFVNYIRHAAYVCTDSFHGSVFSAINHKQFIAFNRYGKDAGNSRNSRLDSLFEQLGIERRFRGDIVSEMMETIGYETVDQRLSSLRRTAEDYLTDALSLRGGRNESDIG